MGSQVLVTTPAIAYTTLGSKLALVHGSTRCWTTRGLTERGALPSSGVATPARRSSVTLGRSALIWSCSGVEGMPPTRVRRVVVFLSEVRHVSSCGLPRAQCSCCHSKHHRLHLVRPIENEATSALVAMSFLR